jgi:hypothetical protein
VSKASIQGVERNIGKVFNEDYVFSIPSYQRPYAWTTEQAGELLDDLIAFIESGDEPEEAAPYFLGSIVLIKGEGPDSRVVDGQQRLTTLAILLAVLRSLVPLDSKDELTTYLYEKGSKIARKPDRYRLTLRERDAEFFQKYIQVPKGLEKLITLDTTGLSDSQRNIRDNTQLFNDRLKKQPDETQDEANRRQINLAQFIINQCFLVVVSTPDDDSAYRIFSVLNDRGLDLSHTDILKAEIIGKISASGENTNEENVYNAKWEEIEESLGRETFQSLFAYIRTIYRKVKLKDTILKEFREYVRPADQPRQFIDGILTPYADAFYMIRNTTYQSTRSAEKVNNLLGWLNKIDNSDWIPPAILFFSRNQNDPEAMLHFFTDLERLAAGLMILRANINKRIERYARLLIAIENNIDLYTSDSPLQLSDGEVKDIIISLDGNLYENWSCKYVLARLDETLSDVQAIYAYTSISIEHVLPQNPAVGSLWLATFPNKEDREKYVHRLGNLVLLSRRKNSEAQNYDFAKKKQRYFTTGRGVSSFALTTQVILKEEWIPEVIEKRQIELMDILKNIWRL